MKTNAERGRYIIMFSGLFTLYKPNNTILIKKILNNCYAKGDFKVVEIGKIKRAFTHYLWTNTK